MKEGVESRAGRMFARSRGGEGPGISRGSLDKEHQGGLGPK